LYSGGTAGRVKETVDPCRLALQNAIGIRSVSTRGAAMPIRFRCVYCNQLLGISKRKAGTIVRCTSCQGQLIVPEPSDPATEAADADEARQGLGPAPVTEAASRPQAASGGVFEDDEFGAFLEPLNGGAGGPAVASAPAPSARRSGPRPTSGVAPGLVTAAAPAPALSVSRQGLTAAILVAVLALGLSFAGGLWLGLALGGTTGSN
jgi:hypothetical protein